MAMTTVPTDVSESSAGEMDHDETRATLAALSLHTEISNHESAMEHMREQKSKIQQLTQELDAIWWVPNHSAVSVGSTPSTAAIKPTLRDAQPPTMINTVATINSTTDKPTVAHDEINGEISYTNMLDCYDTSDKESKHELLKLAKMSGNEKLQSHLMMLREGKTGTSLAKLTKELMKLTES